VAEPESLEEAYASFSALQNEEQLLAAVGATTLSAEEQIAAALQTFAPEEFPDVDVDGLLGIDRVIDVTARGRDALARAVTMRRDDLRNAICPSYVKHASERDAVTAAAPIISDVALTVLGASHPVGFGVAGAIVLVRYGLDKLCADAHEAE
jgi:hypothetical protein